MTNPLPDAVMAVIKEASDDRKMHVSIEESDDYDTVRQVMNARFDRRPSIIAYCASADDVSFWFERANEVPELDEMEFVVRSGGHQHEGRSGDGSDDERIVTSIVLDVSKIDHIGTIDGDQKVWIGTGAKLGDVGPALDRAGYVLPIGACGNVRAGGLTQGGGWGLSWRHLGMTIDKLVAAEIVTPDGHCQTVEGDDDLFWGLRGGGGGNFGVVIQLQFQLTELVDFVDFSLTWDTMPRFLAAQTWTAILRAADDRDDRRLDGFCRMAVVPPADSPRPDEVRPVSLRGWFRGTEDELRTELGPLLDLDYGPDLVVSVRTFTQAYGLLAGSLDESARSLLLEQEPELDPSRWAMQLGAPTPGGPPSSTCEGTAQRHKVSSGYPADASDDLLHALADFFDGADDDPLTAESNLYVSLHAMGGAARDIAHEDTAYSWRDKPFLAQFQAWWSGKEPDDACLDWVNAGIDAISGVCEGGFISFPDERQSISDYYTSDTLDRLQAIKADLTSSDRLRFPLSL